MQKIKKVSIGKENNPQKEKIENFASFGLRRMDRRRG